MTQAKLFDIIELLVDLPEFSLYRGVQGTIVEYYGDEKYEVEFTNQDGVTMALCVLSSKQFIVVWKANVNMSVKRKDFEVKR